MTVYSRAPVWMQNILISAYGLKLRRLRYGETGRAMLDSLRESQWLDANEIRERQLTTLTEVVSRAAADVPFYRRRGLEGVDFETIDQLREIPLLTKGDVQRAGRDMISDQYRGQRLTEVHTGGTTGKPLAIYCDSETLQRNFAFFSRLKNWAGASDGSRTATFAGRTLIPVASRGPYWRRNRAANTLLFSSYHISERSIASYVEALRDFRPELIDAYPSSIEPIARFLLERGITDLRPSAVVTSSETLFPSVRRLVEDAFQCRVFDYYGGAEMASFIAQCEEGSYHVAPEFGVVEVLRDGKPVTVGERGEIVATGFINPVMPMIRYATGDSAIRGSGKCKCGRAGDTLDEIEGRIDDVIVTPEGNLVGRLDPIFKAVSSLYETRIVQDAIDHVRVETVVNGELSRGTERELKDQLRARLGPRMRVDIVRVPAIERTGRGKLRTTINLVYPRPSEESVIPAAANDA